MKKFTLRRLFWIPFILAILITACTLAADFASLIEQKIALERSFEDRLKGLLEKILGTDRFIVIVNVEPETESTEVARETWVQEKTPGEVARKEKKFVLPGVPVREKLGEEKTAEMETVPPGGEMKREYQKVVVLPKSFVRRVLVTIILDEKIEDTLIETVRTVATEILGLDANRGDQLIIKRQRFTEPSQTVLDTMRSSPIYWVVFAVLFVLFLLFPIRIFLRGLARIFQTIRPREVPAAPLAQVLGPGGPLGPEAPRMAEERIGEKTEEKTPRPFSFITQSNLKRLLYLLKDESAETISVIVSYLNPREATQVMASLPRAVKATVTQRLATVREVPPDAVNAMEQSIREKIGYIIGGTEQLVEIVDEADRATREEILQSLREREPEIAEKVRKQIITFEDIANLDNPSFQTVLREVDLGTISLALRGTTEEFKSKIMGKLSEGAQAMLRQEIELGKPAGKQKIEEAQRRIVRVVRELQREERIAFEPVGEARGPGGFGAVVERDIEEAAERAVGTPGQGASGPTGPSGTPEPVEKAKSKTAWVAVAFLVAALMAGFWWYQQSMARKRAPGTASRGVPVEGVKGR